MNKIYIPSAVLFILGLIITILGSLFKIMHWPGASITLIIGMLFEMAAGIVLIIALLKNQKK